MIFVESSPVDERFQAEAGLVPVLKNMWGGKRNQGLIIIVNFGSFDRQYKKNTKVMDETKDLSSVST